MVSRFCWEDVEAVFWVFEVGWVEGLAGGIIGGTGGLWYWGGTGDVALGCGCWVFPVLLLLCNWPFPALFWLFC